MNKEVEILFIQCCNIAAKARLQASWVDFQSTAAKLDVGVGKNKAVNQGPIVGQSPYNVDGQG